MKSKISLLLSVMLVLMLLLPSCGEKAPVELPAVTTDADFAKSPYSHLTNGGKYDRDSDKTANDRFPYDVDAITGATLTVEGPAMKESVPLPVGNLEAHDEVLVRGQYNDTKGTYIYEGADLYEILHSLTDSEGIVPTDAAYRVIIKNSNRADIASFTMTDIEKAHNDGRPVILAYGMGTPDESVIAPFVFDGKTDAEHSPGYEDKLKNDDGCLRLVYDTASYGENKNYKTFANAAYVYVCEETEPGYRHDGAANAAYSDKSLTDYVITFRGKTLGYEIDMTVSQLENLVKYDKNGNVVTGGIGYRDSYSLANNTYWYVNEYEGLKLYELLCYLGMPDYETLGAKNARTTLISFLASDGITSTERFSVDALSYPDAFGFYNKNAADANDGTYQPTNADLVKTGYPVLMAYGFNKYPYVIGKKDAGFLSGLSNSGGPFRIIFGKMNYSHTNGSNQVQYLSDIIVGDDAYYSTHKYSEDEALSALAGNALPLTLTAKGKDAGSVPAFTLGDLEDLLYGNKVTANNKKKAQVKALIGDSIYEGVDLRYIASDKLGIPDTVTGTVTVDTADGRQTISLSDLADGKYVLAFAKNGAPLVLNASSEGYVSERKLNPISSTDPATYAVDNIGGPVQLIIRKDDGTIQTYNDVKSIAVECDVTATELDALRKEAEEAARAAENAVPNANVAWNHAMSEEYAPFGEKTFEVTIKNDAGEWTHTFTVNELEQYTDAVFRDKFTVLELGQCEGLDLWKFVKQLCGYDPKDAGYKAASGNAGVLTASAPVAGLSDVESVTLAAPDGYEIELISIFLKNAVENGIVSDDGRVLPIMLCYGTRGYPLVERSNDDGYMDSADNAYGPIRVVTEKSSQASMKNCVKLTVKIPGTDALPF